MIRKNQIQTLATDQELETLKQASRILGQGHSTFMRSASLEKAHKLLSQLNQEESAN